MWGSKGAGRTLDPSHLSEQWEAIKEGRLGGATNARSCYFSQWSSAGGGLFLMQPNSSCLHPDTYTETTKKHLYIYTYIGGPWCRKCSFRCNCSCMNASPRKWTCFVAPVMEMKKRGHEMRDCRWVILPDFSPSSPASWAVICLVSCSLWSGSDVRWLDVDSLVLLLLF